MFEKTIAFVIERSKGPCGCEHNMGSASSGHWGPDGWVPGKHDQGPCTRRCERCKARETLDADGITYEKDDRRQWEPWMLTGISIDAAPSLMPGVQTFTSTFTGSIMMEPGIMHNGVK